MVQIGILLGFYFFCFLVHIQIIMRVIYILMARKTILTHKSVEYSDQTDTMLSIILF